MNRGRRTSGISLTYQAHLGFGYDKYSCPGCFFAANEVKMVLVYLLVSFDWEASAEGPGRMSIPVWGACRTRMPKRKGRGTTEMFSCEHKDCP